MINSAPPFAHQHSVPPQAPLPPEAPVPRRPRLTRPADMLELGGSLVSAFALTWLLSQRLMPFHLQVAGFVLLCYALFLLTYGLVTWEGHGTVVARDRLMTVLIGTGAVIAFTPLIAVVGLVVYKGFKSLRLNFFYQTLDITGPLSPATDGGAVHSIIGTLEQLGIATVISVPLGVLTAVYLTEVRGPLARPTRLVADAMTALPSIVAGLFIYSLLILQFHFGFSGLAGGLALSVLMLPTVTITAEQVLRVVPGGLREASYALGAPQWRTVVGVLLPTARAGLSTAVILGMARVVGETAPMLLTAFGNTSLNTDPTQGQQDDLPLFIYNQIRSSQNSQVDRAWTGALVLLLLVLLLFILARAAGRGPVHRRGRDGRKTSGKATGRRGR